MATDVPMPKLGLTMEEAMILEWLVPDGATVEADQPIIRIETDKTETEVGAPGSGRLHQIGNVGDVFACGRVIAVLLADGEAPPAATGPATAPAQPAATAATPPRAAPTPAPAPASASSMPGGRVMASPNARRVAADRGVPLRAVRGTGPGGRIVSEDIPATAASVGQAGFVVATFAARSLADLLGVDVGQVPIDPVEQQVTRDGVALHVRTLLQRLATGPSGATAPTAPAPAPLLQEPTETIRLAGMRGTIAKRMHASLQEMAQLTLTMDAEMDAVVADRDGRKGSGGAVPSFTDYVVAATARALALHPRMNAQIAEDGIAVLPVVHVGLAVAVDNGLLVPVVRDTVARNLADLAAETTRLANAARGGAITPADLEGGTFSVSALGAFGVDAFTPVINPPNVGILGVGRLRDDVVVDGKKVGTVKRLTLSLTWDHRVVDGVPAAQFCRSIVELLADPARLD
ncbi:MAG TPA: dihydrolipoamide acetyltransferase family protein [Ilumatobacteraceae bacterium]|nr:dihydrolipoamide acetyltransferase family protein [Ilumatobacteraceae bacterium]